MTNRLSHALHDLKLFSYRAIVDYLPNVTRNSQLGPATRVDLASVQIIEVKKCYNYNDNTEKF